MLGFSEDNTPDYLLPRMEGTPVKEPVIYRSLFILDTIGDRPKSGAPGASIDGPVDPFDDGLPELQRQPAVGVLTVHQQVWVQKGLALGNLLKSICLAPGEVTQVAVIDWQRRTTGASSESAAQGETVTSAIDQSRAVNEIQKAVAAEAQSGGSSTAAASSSAQAAVSGGGLFFSGTASTAATASSAVTAQFSTGSRNLAAESCNALTQSTAETAQALRSRRSAVVREVSEQEAETLSTRVLANYNRRHTLNIEYFEVLQLYEIETKLAGWERCLFVPLQPIDFSNYGNIRKHRATLNDLFHRWGRADLLERLAEDVDQAAIAAGVEKAIKEKEAYIFEESAKRVRYTDEIQACSEMLGLMAALGAVDAMPIPDAAKKAQRQPLYERIRYLESKNPAIIVRDVSPAGQAAIIKNLNTRKGWLATIDARLKLANSELADLRKKRADLDLSLGEFLNANQLFLSQQIWLNMDSFRIYRMLQGRSIGKSPLSMLVDPRPVGVFGNYLAFRWGFGRGGEADAERAQFENTYIGAESTVAEGAGTVIALPTSGVFAEAVLGRGEAAEVIDEERLWRWEDYPIPILPPKIADIQSRDRAKPVDLVAAGFANPLAALRAQDPSGASYVDRVLGQLGKGDMFRNMSGLAEAVTLADRLAAVSGQGAAEAGKRSVELHSKILDTFVEVLNSDVGKAAVAEFMLPGAGAALLGANGGGGKRADDANAGGAVLKAVVDGLGDAELDAPEE